MTTEGTNGRVTEVGKDKTRMNQHKRDKVIHCLLIHKNMSAGLFYMIILYSVLPNKVKIHIKQL